MPVLGGEFPSKFRTGGALAVLPQYYRRIEPAVPIINPYQSDSGTGSYFKVQHSYN